MSTPIDVVPYDPEWPQIFERLHRRLKAHLGDLALRIEHVGSTAVPGLSAKSIIDLDVVIRGGADLTEAITALRRLGYAHEGDGGIQGREMFTTPADAPPHHLYVCAAGNRELARHLAFRDLLRAEPMTARAYADLKADLAVRFRDDRRGYSEAKGAFIEQALSSIISRVLR
ncbi:GrpB family protein [Planotetraspora kaengkrachanensis]|uniref:GrpB family protein n=1 Tax=Planotetraspora kaengkrachanensis TaxID=575193 RepID=A0A8J3PQW8_9ACTN|nr:GrpB family protein [Planotetraspora kaengkrachanensis]GIG78542.1 hypothetical protein Pka01_16690 [Planotetraspora kaengkrachanensis]